ncbi:GNAT family N-acetyltransferase [Paenibacillus lautus]|uniref:GNAT family N-acetyltransferase n=1 Tax=Paenibacillus lautus TaxID=1401 RepID=UPI003D2718CB
MDTEIKGDILNLIEKISPQGRNYVNEAFNNNMVKVFYYNKSIDEHGVFCIVENNDCNIAYFSFLNEPNKEKCKGLIMADMKPFINEVNEKELCFNVYGKNVGAIEFVQSLGFKADMEGYHLFYNRQEAPVISQSELIEKQFEDSMLDHLVELFDKGYFQLNKENGWQTDWYYTNSKVFQAGLQEKVRDNEFRSFWLGNQLIGAYIIDKNYIRDLVVSPGYQNRGYGSIILAHCIKHMIEKKNVQKVCLRITKSNLSAKRLYERNHFEELACFAEHTFISNINTLNEGEIY